MTCPDFLVNEDEFGMWEDGSSLKTVSKSYLLTISLLDLILKAVIASWNTSGLTYGRIFLKFISRSIAETPPTFFISAILYTLIALRFFLCSSSKM